MFKSRQTSQRLPGADGAVRAAAQLCFPIGETPSSHRRSRSISGRGPLLMQRRLLQKGATSNV